MSSGVKKMKIACVQMNIKFGKPETNYNAIEKYIREASNIQSRYNCISRNVEYRL